MEFKKGDEVYILSTSETIEYTNIMNCDIDLNAVYTIFKISSSDHLFPIKIKNVHGSLLRFKISEVVHKDIYESPLYQAIYNNDTNTKTNNTKD